MLGGIEAEGETGTETGTGTATATEIEEAGIVPLNFMLSWE